MGGDPDARRSNERIDFSEKNNVPGYDHSGNRGRPRVARRVSKPRPRKSCPDKGSWLEEQLALLRKAKNQREADQIRDDIKWAGYSPVELQEGEDPDTPLWSRKWKWSPEKSSSSATDITKSGTFCHRYGEWGQSCVCSRRRLMTPQRRLMMRLARLEAAGSA